MDVEQEWLRIGAFAELVGLSVPQLRRYDRLGLLEPAGRSADSGYRYYTTGQSGAARVIALLRSMDMPIGEIRRIICGATEAEQGRIFADHRERLEARLEEARRLLQAVDALTQENSVSTETCVSSWLHLMPRIPVTDMERSLAYYQEVLDFQLNWHTPDRRSFTLASGRIESLMLTERNGQGDTAAAVGVRLRRRPGRAVRRIRPGRGRYRAAGGYPPLRHARFHRPRP